MNLETAYLAVREALAAVEGLSEPRMTVKHPDVWISQGATFPVCSLAWSEKRNEGYDRVHRWAYPKGERAVLELHVVITDKTDHYSLELIRFEALIRTAIEALSTADGTGFSCAVTDGSAAYDAAGRWGWGVFTLMLGEFEK